MQDLNTVQLLVVLAPPLLLAITLHEVAHGWVALRCGDATAQSQGRLSLNPLRHIDPIGTVLVPALLAIFGGFIFGWAKPVPVNFSNLRHPKRDMRYVAVAGPLANLAMAIGWVLLFKLSSTLGGYFGTPLALMCQAGVMINVSLMVLNLLPIPPLDGGRILVSLLPQRQAYSVSRIEPYGMWILIALIFTGLLTTIMRPFMGLVYGFLNLFL